MRLASGIVLIPVLLGITYLDGPLYAAVICLACGLAAVEVRGMLRAAGYAPLDIALFGLAVLLPLDTWLRLANWWPVAPDGVLLVVLIVMLSLIALLTRQRFDRSLADAAVSVLTGLYIGGLMQFFLPLRQLASPVLPGLWVMGLLALSWACDTSAYFVGRAFGRTPLAPSISPKKSREGAIAGLVGATLAGLLLAVLSGYPVLWLAGYGFVIGLATIIGDLVESLLKRQTGVKDSGILIPGHGGLLDRMDSLLFCAPVAVLYLNAIGV